MSWDIDTAKANLGITDTSQDVALQLCLDTALAIVEGWLDRKLLLATETEVFHEPKSCKLWVERYPLVEVLTINGDDYNPAAGYEIEQDNGWIKGPWPATPITLEYTGGYDPLPPDLEFALWQVFGALWAAMNQATGLPATDGGTSIDGIDSITVPDVGTVRFTSAANTAATTGGVLGDMAAWLPYGALSILYKYKRESC